MTYAILSALALAVFLAIHLAGARDAMRRAEWSADAFDVWPTDDEGDQP